MEDVFDEVWIGLEVAAAFLDGGQGLDHGVGKPAFALDAADGGGAAALGGSLLSFWRGEDLVKVEDGADVGVAGVGAVDAGGVGDHGLELGADFGFGV